MPNQGSNITNIFRRCKNNSTVIIISNELELELELDNNGVKIDWPHVPMSGSGQSPSHSGYTEAGEKCCLSVSATSLPLLPNNCRCLKIQRSNREFEEGKGRGMGQEK